MEEIIKKTHHKNARFNVVHLNLQQRPRAKMTIFHWLWEKNYKENSITQEEKSLPYKYIFFLINFLSFSSLFFYCRFFLLTQMPFLLFYIVSTMPTSFPYEEQYYPLAKDLDILLFCLWLQVKVFTWKFLSFPSLNICRTQPGEGGLLR